MNNINFTTKRIKIWIFLRLTICLLAVINSTYVKSQIITTTSSFKNINGNKYARIQFDNDYFTKTDRYYTQGINAELVHPIFKKSPLDFLLLIPKGSDSKYGISIDHFIYTPINTGKIDIALGDRPFSSNFSLKRFSINTNFEKKNRLSSGVTVGIIGEATGGKELQINVHHVLKNEIPRGWKYQIKNDLILNYQINYEKNLLANSFFLMNGIGDIKLGTHTNKIAIGTNFMMGNLDNTYQLNLTGKNKKVQYYLYGQAKIGLTGYDATLQGGMFNKNSPYTIGAKDIKRFNFQGDYGIIIQFKKLYLEYSQSYLTKEFKTGKAHQWGNVSVGWKL